MKPATSWVAALFFAVSLSACASSGDGNGGPGEMEIRTGRVEQITLTQMQTNHDTGIGAVLGGVGGAALGSLVGGGTGRDVAMVAGALGGALGGNYMEKKHYDQPKEAEQVIVRMNNGVLVSVTQPINQSLAKGMKVFIEGTGNEARVVPQN
jgi:outer membrane lipoprotein SlyB